MEPYPGYFVVIFFFFCKLLITDHPSIHLPAHSRIHRSLVVTFHGPYKSKYDNLTGRSLIITSYHAVRSILSHKSRLKSSRITRTNVPFARSWTRGHKCMLRENALDEEKKYNMQCSNHEVCNQN